MFGKNIQDVVAHDLRWFNVYLVIHHEHAGDLAQAVCVDSSSDCLPVMAPMKSAMKAKKVAMKAMKGQKVMTKGALLGELANLTEMKKADISKVLNTLTEIGTQEVKKAGKFILPGLCMIKTRTKAAVKGGGTRMMFGKEVTIKSQPAKTVVKAFPVSQLKSQIWGHGWFAKFGHGAVAKDC